MTADHSEANRHTYDHPLVAAVYDEDNPFDEDRVAVVEKAAAWGSTRVVDLGCGTGLLTVALARERRSVVGIDPAGAMLDIARARPGGDRVEWRHGGAELIRPGEADLVTMTANVAMHILGEDWHATLRSIAAGLVPGGRVLLETRNPAMRAWERWPFPERERVTAAGPVRESETVTAPDADGVVLMVDRTQPLDDRGAPRGEPVVAEQRLQFRSEERLRADLAAAGLEVARVDGDWLGAPFDPASSQILVVEARKA